MMTNPVALGLASLSMSLLGAACVAADGPVIGESQGGITNGHADPTDHQVVQVFPPNATASCTGTLIGFKTVLTAGHCLGSGTTPITVSGETGIFDPELRQNVWEPYTTQGTPVMQAGSDVALVILPIAVRGITPSKVASSVQAGLSITLVGYGQTALGVGGGTRNLAFNTIDSVDATQWYFTGVGGTDGATCFGDSGGPAYKTATSCIVGITRGESTAPNDPTTCTNAGGFYIDTRVDPQVGWIQAHAPETVSTCTP